MKTTYLVNQEQPDGSVCLTVVSSTVWRTIVERNKQFPLDQQRYFIIDYIDDGTELDRMVIEVQRKDYLVWLREHNASMRNRRWGEKYQHLSLDVFILTAEGVVSFGDTIRADDQTDETVLNQLLLADLRQKLSAWKPWANDLLDAYLQGDRRTCTDALALKYEVSPQAIRKYKRQFENFIKNFLSGVSL